MYSQYSRYGQYSSYRNHYKRTHRPSHQPYNNHYNDYGKSGGHPDKKPPNQAPNAGHTYVQTGYAPAFHEPGVKRSVDFNIFQDRNDPNTSFHATKVSSTGASDPDGDQLTVTPLSSGSSDAGSLTYLGNGNYRWTTNPHFNGHNYGVREFSYQVSDGHESSVGKIKVYVTPIALDLNGDGVQTTALGDTNGTFDLKGDGNAIESGWLSGEDAFLAVDANGNGTIDDISELFGGIDKGDGFAKLATYDTNNDGLIDSEEILGGGLQLWKDSNANHQTDAGELISLASQGIESLNTDFEDKPLLQNGNLLIEHGSATKTDGSKIDMVDAYFQAADTAAPVVSSASDATFT